MPCSTSVHFTIFAVQSSSWAWWPYIQGIDPLSSGRTFWPYMLPSWYLGTAARQYLVHATLEKYDVAVWYRPYIRDVLSYVFYVHPVLSLVHWLRCTCSTPGALYLLLLFCDYSISTFSILVFVYLRPILYATWKPVLYSIPTWNDTSIQRLFHSPWNTCRTRYKMPVYVDDRRPVHLPFRDTGVHLFVQYKATGTFSLFADFWNCDVHGTVQ